MFYVQEKVDGQGSYAFGVDGVCNMVVDIMDIVGNGGQRCGNSMTLMLMTCGWGIRIRRRL